MQGLAPKAQQTMQIVQKEAKQHEEIIVNNP